MNNVWKEEPPENLISSHEDTRESTLNGDNSSSNYYEEQCTKSNDETRLAFTSSEESTHSSSFQGEIFEADEIPGIPCTATDQRTRVVTEGTPPSGDGRSNNNPPLSLHVGTNKNLQCNSEHDGINGSSYLPSKFINTSESTSSLAGSVSTTTSSSTTGITPRSMEKPILYSAIGSLESPNGISAGSFAKRLYPQKFGKVQLSSSALMPPLDPPPQSHNQVSSSGKSENRAKPVDNRHRLGAQQIVNKHEATTGTNSRTTPKTNNANDTLTNSAVAETANQIKQIQIQKDPSSTNITHQKQREIEETKKSRTIRSQKPPSSLRTKSSGTGGQQTSASAERAKSSKRVSYGKDLSSRSGRKKPIEMFRPSCDAYTPRIGKKSIKYKAAEMRTPGVQNMATPMGTLQRPNFRDALKRVAMIIHQHIVKIERRFETSSVLVVDDKRDNGLFKKSMKDTFDESKYRTPTYRCTMVRIPGHPGTAYGLKQIKTEQEIPSEEEIYEFGHQLFKAVQLSSECSIVCLIYVERLMEVAKVPLLACTWRPIVMCGLLLASKVWQDLSSWNIEFASVYPQYSLDAINRLELNFLRMVKWDLYISSRYVCCRLFLFPSCFESLLWNSPSPPPFAANTAVSCCIIVSTRSITSHFDHW